MTKIECFIVAINQSQCGGALVGVDVYISDQFHTGTKEGVMYMLLKVSLFMS